MFGNEICFINRVQLRCLVEWYEIWIFFNGYYRLYYLKVVGDEGFYLCVFSSYNSINLRRGILVLYNLMIDFMGVYMILEIFGVV